MRQAGESVCHLGGALARSVVSAIGSVLACSGSAPISPSFVPAPSVCEDAGLAPQFFRYADLPCPLAADVEAVRGDVAITFDDVAWSPVVCEDVPNSMPLTYFEERVYQALIFMRNVRFSTPLPEKWTGGRELYDWFRQAIRGIVVERGDRAYCCSPEKVIRLGMGDTSTIPVWRRTVVESWVPGIVHEARHADIHIPHTCPTNHSKDAHTTDMGACGVQSWLMVWIAEYSDAPAETREWYRYSSKSFRFSAFCDECSNSPGTAQMSLSFLTPGMGPES